MEVFSNFIMQFGSLNKQQIEVITSKTTIQLLRKDEYFSDAGKIPRQVGFILEGVVRGYYYDNKGEEITRCFIAENNLVVDYMNFEKKTASTDYIQACTDCKIIIFSKLVWDELSNSISEWEIVKHKMIQLCLYQKSRIKPIISQDATTRYLEFMENHPTLINRVALSHIASYIGITQQSLSRIRKNIR